MAKINHLLEERIELSDYENMYGELPKSLSKDHVQQAEEEDKESAYSSSSEELVESDYQVKDLGKVEDEVKKSELEPNLFDVSLPPRLSFMSFGRQQLKKPQNNFLFGRQLNNR